MLTEDRQAQKAQRRATAVVAGVVALLALVIVGAVVFVVRGGGPGTSSARSPVIPTESSGNPGQNSGQVAAPSGEKLTSDGVSWSDFHGIPVPTSSAGPRNVDGARASGFARSPAGAVLAAIHISYRVGSSAGPAVFEPTIAAQVVGADKDKFLATTEASYSADAGRYGAASDGSLPSEFARAVREGSRVWAYRTDAYDSSLASIHVLSRTQTVGATDPTYVDFAYTVRWVDGDWRLVAPLNGDWRSVTTATRTVPNDYIVIGRP